MAENHGVIFCNLCGREYKKYDKKDCAKIFGVSITRSNNWSQVMKFVSFDKSEVNRHICTYCISDVLNKFHD